MSKQDAFLYVHGMEITH